MGRLGRRGGHRPGSPPDGRSGPEPRLGPQRLVSGLPARSGAVQGVLHRRAGGPGPLGGVPAAHPAAADPGAHPLGGQVGVDDLQPRPGRPGLPQSRCAGRDDPGPAVVRRARGPGDPPRRGGLSLEGDRHLLHPSAPDAPGHPPVSCRPRRCGALGPDRDGDQRPAPGQHLLLRRWDRRGPDGVSVSPSAPGARRLSPRRRRALEPLGRGSRRARREHHVLQLPGLPRRGWGDACPRYPERRPAPRAGGNGRVPGRAGVVQGECLGQDPLRAERHLLRRDR